MLQDSYFRTINYLRISVTDRCNLMCQYCKPRKIVSKLHQEILTFEEITQIVKCFASLGVSKIRLSGGEPLLRKNLEKLIYNLKQIQEINDISLTTNGFNLLEKAILLKEYGLSRLNISLDTLDKGKFKKITGCDIFDQVMAGIHQAHELELKLKINVVIMKSINFNEIKDFINLALDLQSEVRFIELMPTQTCFSFAKEEWVSSTVVKKVIFDDMKINVKPLESEGVAELYAIENSQARIGFINPLSKMFCASCNRVRLRSDGLLKLCLHENENINLKTMIRKGMNQKELIEVIKDAIKIKPKEHHLQQYDYKNMLPLMSQIGG